MLNNIKRFREEQKLSILFVASLLNITQEEYVEIENSELRQTNVEILKNLATLLGVSVYDFEIKERTEPQRLQGMFRTYQSLTDHDSYEIQKLVYFKKRDALLNAK